MHGAVLLRNLKQTGAQPLRNSHSYFPVGAPCQYCTSSTEHRVKFLRGQRWRRHFFERVKPSQSQAPQKRWKRFANDFWQGPKSEMVMFTWSAPVLYLSIDLSIFLILSCWRPSCHTMFFPFILFTCTECLNIHVWMQMQSCAIEAHAICMICIRYTFYYQY